MACRNPLLSPLWQDDFRSSRRREIIASLSVDAAPAMSLGAYRILSNRRSMSSLNCAGQLDLMTDSSVTIFDRVGASGVFDKNVWSKKWIDPLEIRLPTVTHPTKIMVAPHTMLRLGKKTAIAKVAAERTKKTN